MKYSGERFIPQSVSSTLITYEHWHRYHFVTKLIEGKAVLDVASGAGYGTALMSNACSSVIGVDISEETVAYANEKYKKDNLQFLVGSVTELNFPDKSFDIITSFETIEHISEDDQHKAMREFSRLLKDDGILIISTPNLNSDLYQDVDNEFHLKEFYYNEFNEFIRNYFQAIKVFGQSFLSASSIYSDSHFDLEILTGINNNLQKLIKPDTKDAKFIIAVCSKNTFPDEVNNQLTQSTLLDQKNDFFSEYDRYVHSLQDHLQSKDADIKNGIKYFDELQKKINTLENIIDEQKEINASLEKNLLDSQSSNLELTENTNQKNSDIAYLDEMVRDKDASLLDAAESYKLLEVRLKELEYENRKYLDQATEQQSSNPPEGVNGSQVDERNSSIKYAEHEAVIKNLTLKLSEKERIILQQKEQAEEFGQNNSDLIKNNAQLLNEIESVRAEYGRLKSEVVFLQESMTNTEEKLSVQSQQLKIERDEFHEYRVSALATQQELKRVKREKIEAIHQKDLLETELNELTSLLETQDANFQKMQLEMSKLEIKSKQYDYITTLPVVGRFFKIKSKK